MTRTFGVGPVAQWIEHLIPNQGVAGSSPAGVASSPVLKGSSLSQYTQASGLNVTQQLLAEAFRPVLGGRQYPRPDVTFRASSAW